MSGPAIYKHFSGKEELCMAVLDSIHSEQIEGVVSAFSGSGTLDERRLPRRDGAADVAPVL